MALEARSVAEERAAVMELLMQEKSVRAQVDCARVGVGAWRRRMERRESVRIWECILVVGW